MTNDISFAVQIISIGIFIFTVLGWAIKYGSDQQKLESRNEVQDIKMNNLEKMICDDKSLNEKEHAEFYATNKTAIELKSDMKYILSSLDEIKKMLTKERAK